MIRDDNYPNFCVLPFILAFQTKANSYRACCEYRDAVEGEDFKELWNGDYFKDIRRKFNNREMPEGCKNCVADEMHGLESHRKYVNSLYEEKTKEYFNAKVLDAPPPTYFDMRFDNYCNLECVMCHGIDSSAIDKRVKEWKKPLSILTLDKDYGSNDKFLEFVYENIQHVTDLHFAGGEPLLSKDMKYLIEYCVEHDCAKNINIWITTNCTIARKKWFEDYLLKFKHVKLICSVDATEDLLEYVRYPSKWSVVKRNMLYFKELQDNNDNFYCHLSPCIHLMNFHGLPDLVDFAVEHNIDINCSIVHSTNADDKFLHYTRLPVSYRKPIIDKIRSKLDQLDNLIHHNFYEIFLNKLSDTEQIIGDEQERKSFTDTVEYWDSHKTKFLDLYSDLEFLLDK